MAVSAENRLAISELIALHGHIMDSGELDRLEDLFSPEDKARSGHLTDYFLQVSIRKGALKQVQAGSGGLAGQAQRAHARYAVVERSWHRGPRVPVGTVTVRLCGSRQ